MNDYIIEVISSLDMVGIFIIVGSLFEAFAFSVFGGMTSETMTEDEQKCFLKIITICCVFMFIGVLLVVFTPSKDVLYNLMYKV